MGTVWGRMGWTDIEGVGWAHTLFFWAFLGGTFGWEGLRGEVVDLFVGLLSLGGW